MTKKEAVIIETYTGVCMLTGDDRELSYKYAEELLGHPFYTHMWADSRIVAKLKELSKPDFLEICANLADGVETKEVVHGEWIAQDEGLTKFMCSACKGKFHGGYEKFCPDCGADMRKKV